MTEYVVMEFKAVAEVPQEVAERVMADPELKRVTFVQHVRMGEWSYDLRPFGEWKLIDD